MKRTISKVLVANRGEIAVRIIRGLQELGIRSVAIYSEVDRETPAVLLADEAYCVGPAPSSESYLRGEAIVELAQKIGADAIHPGYGFLSENADFARQCEAAGVIFIGPTADAISSMGSKIESRRLMQAAGVPVVPGGTDAVDSVEAAQAEAERIGFPVMLKASAGGGGKGMRLVEEPDQLPAAFRAATSEAGASFGDSSVYVERFIQEPRHVEIQILGDEHGTVVSLGERECSLQRRHQKVVEEAPSVAVDKELRARMGKAAVEAGTAVEYRGAGTVEFLLDKSGEFYFLEMNTRLQVEHPVTELVSGIDLVHAQLRVAQGEPLPESYSSVEPRGWAIEVRIYAEDPYNGFAPSPGRIDLLRLPEGPGVRTDAGIRQGGEVTIYYDPMIAKMIVWGEDREQAMQRLERALCELRIDGIKTTVPLFLDLLADEDFRSGNMDIGMLDRKLSSGELQDARRGEAADEPDDLPIVAAAIARLAEVGKSGVAASATAPVGARSRWAEFGRRESLRLRGP
ncbi:MAG: acetyl-CoA carboxylase biotin carboxylase subunit [Acidobacteriota bacterium]